MIIIPAIDLRGGRCVRLVQGRAADETVYSENPVAMARRWYDAGAEILHVVNLDGAMGKDDRDNLKALERILYEVDIPVQFGGGVRSIDDVRRLDDLGATRIVLGTTTLENPVLLEHIVGEFASTIVVGIDAREGRVSVRGWEKTSSVEAVVLAQKVADMGVERIVFTDIDRDGMMNGVNVESTRQIAEASGVRVTASGGVGSLDDVAALKEIESYGVDSVIIGKALYECRFTLEDALDLADE